jgi:hypothetical protein
MALNQCRDVYPDVRENGSKLHLQQPVLNSNIIYSVPICLVTKRLLSYKIRIQLALVEYYSLYALLSID